jgi:hypothetical protein
MKPLVKYGTVQKLAGKKKNAFEIIAQILKKTKSWWGG